MPHRSSDGTGSALLTTDVQVARFQAGDDSAFDILHTRFAPLLERRVLGHPNWPHLAKRCDLQDVVQEVWARLVPAARRSFTPSGPGSFLAFLATLTDRTIIDLARRQSAVKRGAGGEPQRLDTHVEVFGDANVRVSREETPTSSARRSELESIAEAVLSEREYAAFELVELQDYTAAEAGLAIRKSASAVRGLLLRARQKLTERLPRP